MCVSTFYGDVLSVSLIFVAFHCIDVLCAVRSGENTNCNEKLTGCLCLLECMEQLWCAWNQNPYCRDCLLTHLKLREALLFTYRLIPVSVPRSVMSSLSSPFSHELT